MITEIKKIIDIVDKKLCINLDMSKDYSSNDLKEAINRCIDELELRMPSIAIYREDILQSVYNGRRRLGIIQPLLDDPSVNEIMINGTEAIFIEQDGIIKEYSQRYTSRDKLFNAVQIMVSWVNRTVNESHPILDARLMNGSRVSVVLNPVAINGPVVTIRKFSEKPFTLDTLTEVGTITEEEREYLISCVKEKKNMLISGSTATGKTTFLNALARLIKNDRRIISIEDSAELVLSQPNVVRLETRNANTEGKGEITMRSLIKAALRMRPDHLIIGEVRDESALDMLTALCTGHDGSMSTIHANSAVDMLVRLETLALWEGHISSMSIRKMIVSGIDMIVHLERSNDKRKVKEIAVIEGIEDDNICIRYVFRNGVREH